MDFLNLAYAFVQNHFVDVYVLARVLSHFLPSNTIAYKVIAYVLGHLPAPTTTENVKLNSNMS